MLALAILIGASSAAPNTAEDISATTVSREVLLSTIQNVEEDSGLSQGQKARLLDIYRQALGHLEGARVFDEKAAGFTEASRVAPEETRLIQQDLAALQAQQTPQLPVSLEQSLTDIENAFQQAEAALVTARSALRIFEDQLVDIEGGPAVISTLREEAQQKLQRVIASRRSPASVEPSAELAQAKSWLLEARYLELSAGLRMLEQELQSHPLRKALLQAKLSRQQQLIRLEQAKVTALEDLVNRKRQAEAELAQRRSEQALQQLVIQDPVFARLADQNRALTTELQQMTAQLDNLSREKEQAQSLIVQLGVDLRDAQLTVARSAPSRALGEILLKQQQSLPNSHLYARRLEMRAAIIDSLAVRRLQYREEIRQLAQPAGQIEQLALSLAIPRTPAVDKLLLAALQQRKQIVESAIEAEAFYLEQLSELDLIEQQLLELTEDYRLFLTENLLWLRTSSRLRWPDLPQAWEELGQLLSWQTWSPRMEPLWEQAKQEKAFVAVLLLALLLRLRQKSLFTRIQSTRQKIGSAETDRLRYTTWAMLLTLLAASPVPTVMSATGWLFIQVSEPVGQLYRIGNGLLASGLNLLPLLWLRTLCIPKGVARCHFNWPATTVKTIRQQIDILCWIFVVVVLIITLSNLNPTEAGGSLTRLALLVLYAHQLPFFYYLFHPRRGVLGPMARRHPRQLVHRSATLWFAVLLAFPITMAILTIIGYTYSSAYLTLLLLQSLFLLVGLAIMAAYLLRWLLLFSNQVALKQARKLQAHAQSEERQTNITSLSEDIKELLRLIITFSGLVGLYWIWSPLFPALNVLEEIVLWTTTLSEGGIESLEPYTLADLALTLGYVIATWILAKHLPALLEIVLLKRSTLGSGSRYTLVTLTAYSIVALGSMLILNTIGAQWSKLQWLVAALGVGIGFGLQEIVANFISGLIILFERPIRVGDTVTVAGTSGVVTRIRIRATTIRSWDCKELLVPNKEFVTGQLLNWTLSDQTSRLIIEVTVKHGEHVEQALKRLEAVARANPEVTQQPAPQATFQAFSASGYELRLRVFLSGIEQRQVILSQLNREINRSLQEAGIEVAFPMRESPTSLPAKKSR